MHEPAAALQDTHRATPTIAAFPTSSRLTLDLNLPIATPTPPITPLAANKPAPSQADAPAKATKNRIRTVLVASFGWPTEAAQPAKKRAAKR
ncbi:MAG: hypothetical protein QM722_22890 [Piscinibacter sp.]